MRYKIQDIDTFISKNYGRIDAEDESIEVAKEDVIEGLSRHGKFVRMPDNKMFKVETTRSFSILCFTDSSNVPEVSIFLHFL